LSKESIRAALDALERGEAFAWVTVLSVQGSSPGQPGQKMIVYPDGRQEGTVGGGGLELRASQDALALLREGHGGVLVYQLDPDEPGSIDALCGGNTTMAVEVFPPAVHLLICGAGHLGLALARQSIELCYVCTVVDARAELATRERFPRAAEIHVEPPPDLVRRSGLSRYSHVIILTHEYDLDRQTLEAVWRTGFEKYVGMIGSRRKWMELRSRLIEAGLPSDWLDRVRCPIGLAIGARTPAEIAVAIAAEILQESPQRKHGSPTH
jgi:xanthine dehydrogenase accessory factor